MKPRTFMRVTIVWRIAIIKSLNTSAYSCEIQTPMRRWWLGRLKCRVAGWLEKVYKFAYRDTFLLFVCSTASSRQVPTSPTGAWNSRSSALRHQENDHGNKYKHFARYVVGANRVMPSLMRRTFWINIAFCAECGCRSMSLPEISVFRLGWG